MSRIVWYEELRYKYRPPEVRLLFIAESPPDPRGGDRRFFYAPTLKVDNLYRGVAEALYGLEPNFDIRQKLSNLDRMRTDDVWLIDAVKSPVNGLTSSDRRAAIRRGKPQLIELCQEINPTVGAIICHSVVYREVAEPLRTSGIKILHDSPLPFPLGNWRRKFVDLTREAIAGHQPPQPLSSS